MIALVPRLSYIKAPTKKQSYKRSPVGPGGPGSLKMIFAWLIEVIAVHMQLIIIHFLYLRLKGLFTLRRGLCKSLVQLQVSPHELFEQFIRRRQSRSGNRSRNQSGNQFGDRGRVTRQSGGGICWMKTFNWARISGKLIFYKVKRKEVPTGRTTRAEFFWSHLGRWLDWIGE